MALQYVTTENFEEEVLKSKVPVVIDFYADWCGPCRMMAPVFEELSRDYAPKVKLMKLDTEAETEIAQSFQVMSIPTLIVIKNGKEIGRVVGFGPKQAIKQKIDEVLMEND